MSSTLGAVAHVMQIDAVVLVLPQGTISGKMSEITGLGGHLFSSSGSNGFLAASLARIAARGHAAKRRALYGDLERGHDATRIKKRNWRATFSLLLCHQICAYHLCFWEFALQLLCLYLSYSRYFHLVCLPDCSTSLGRNALDPEPTACGWKNANVGVCKAHAAKRMQPELCKA